MNITHSSIVLSYFALYNDCGLEKGRGVIFNFQIA